MNKVMSKIISPLMKKLQGNYSFDINGLHRAINSATEHDLQGNVVLGYLKESAPYNMMLQLSTALLGIERTNFRKNVSVMVVQYDDTYVTMVFKTNKDIELKANNVVMLLNNVLRKKTNFWVSVFPLSKQFVKLFDNTKIELVYQNIACTLRLIGSFNHNISESITQEIINTGYVTKTTACLSVNGFSDFDYLEKAVVTENSYRLTIWRLLRLLDGYLLLLLDGGKLVIELTLSDLTKPMLVMGVWENDYDSTWGASSIYKDFLGYLDNKLVSSTNVSDIQFKLIKH